MQEIQKPFSIRKYGFALSLFLILIFNLGNSPMESKRPFSGSDYWFFSYIAEKMEKKDSGNGTVSVRYLYQGKWKAFTINKDEIEKNKNKRGGYLRAFDHYLDVVKNDSRPVVRLRAEKNLHRLTAGAKNVGYRNWKVWIESFRRHLTYADCFQALVIELSPSTYWRYLLFEKQPIVIKEKRDKNGYLCFRRSPDSVGFIIKVNKIQGPKAKSDGYKMVLRENVENLKANKIALNLIKYFQKYPSLSDEVEPMFAQNENSRQEWINRLRILTGMDFKSSEEWLAWYEKNNDRLIFSEERGHLIIKP